MSAGNLTATPDLCSDTTLYFNAADRDGSGCPALPSNSFWGPGWNGARSVGPAKTGCNFDDVGYSSGIGPCQPSIGVDPGSEYCIGASADGFPTPAVGFGAALGLNTATPATGGNNMRVYVR